MPRAKKSAEPVDPFAALVTAKPKKVRAKRVPADGPKPPTRKECAAIIRRFLKTDKNILWSREMPCFYRLWKRYPSRPFWERYELPFGNNKLNHMSWFESIEGEIELASAYPMFHWTPAAPSPEVTAASPEAAPPAETNPLDTVGSTPIPSPIVVPPSRPRTVADMFKAKTPPQT